MQRPTRFTRTDTPWPHQTLFRSDAAARRTLRLSHRAELPARRIVLHAGPVLARRPSLRSHGSIWPIAHRPRRPRARQGTGADQAAARRSEEHTSELQSLMRISTAVLCLIKNTTQPNHYTRD